MSIREDICNAANVLASFGGESLVGGIKAHLVEEWGAASWEGFQDSLELGDCRPVSKSVKSYCGAHGLDCKHVMGNVHTDYPVFDDEGNKDDHMLHHWVIVDGETYDFAKGTLLWHDVFDIYDPTPEWEYVVDRYGVMELSD